ncbi:hypothetical protein AXG93_464s1150 [Marchantia polymorpha subsp. ruderalis]|uniref:Uncharacterized protein n=1 Tax=Marchantia polymorpha subsp. ruderalis TaxID=1480154 RepID=A0A176WSX5_MARPO|nr:hypothetical protein AXG93_464s1150 [Marchantia polymorpha subsp. ruderalis]
MGMGKLSVTMKLKENKIPGRYSSELNHTHHSECRRYGHEREKQRVEKLLADLHCKVEALIPFRVQSPISSTGSTTEALAETGETELKHVSLHITEGAESLENLAILHLAFVHVCSVDVNLMSTKLALS